MSFVLLFGYEALFAQRQRPCHIGAYDRRIFEECMESGRRKCAIDTTEFTGSSIEINLLTGWSLGEYSRSGNNGTGFGFGLGYAYQPFNSLPLELYAGIGLLYADVRNKRAALSVYPLDEDMPPIPFSVQVNIKNELFLGNAALRCWLPTKYWQPYAMAGVGLVGHSSLLRMYDDDKIVFLGTSSDGLLLESRVSHNSAFSKLFAAGVVWNAGYLVSLDLRCTLIHAGKYDSSEPLNAEDWNLKYSETDSSGNPASLDAESDGLFKPSRTMPMQMLLINLGCTLLVGGDE